MNRLIKIEKNTKLHSNETLLKFKKKIFDLQKKVNQLFLKINSKQKVIAGYGAPALKLLLLRHFLI